MKHTTSCTKYCLCLFIVLAGCASPVLAEERPAVALWKFDGDLRDESGWGRDLTVKDACFAHGRCGQALKFDREYVQAPSRPELELAPGLRIACWVKFSEQPAGYHHFVCKDGEYMLRVDPPSEGSRFAFFVNLNGSWEPRVRSGEPVKPGVWYHVIAQWDGKKTTLQVNGKRESVRRSGLVRPMAKPLEFGALDGMIDELRIENPVMRHPRAKAADMLVANWPFDGGLGDSSGRGHDIKLADARFVPGRNGQALQFGAERALIPKSPDLEVAPNLRIECQVYFDRESADYRPIVFKDGEYLLRVDNLAEGGRFSFFVGIWAIRGARKRYPRSR